jgi:hypothetical protein
MLGYFSGTRDFLEEEKMHEVKKESWNGVRDSRRHGKGFKSRQQIILNSSQRQCIRKHKPLFQPLNNVQTIKEYLINLVLMLMLADLS